MTAIVSILHRMTGILLFLFIPCLLWLLWYSLSSAQNFQHLQHYMDYFWLRFAAWVFISALIYHLVAGIRHLLMDMHVGDSLGGGRFGAWLVMAIGFVLIVAIGVYILCGFNHAIW
jgi:succinate dehydrogenase / fumarate reductase, cytochrome b subunit